jgi:hypothetical protein
MTIIAKFLRPLGLTVATIAAGNFLIQSAPAQAAQLVNNGYFSQGSAGWTKDGDANITDIATIPALSAYIFLGNVGAVGSVVNPLQISTGSWSQNLSTVSGSTYSLTYIFANYASLANTPVNAQFQVKVNNTILDTLTGTGMISNIYNQTFTGSGNDLLTFTFTGVAASAIDNVLVNGLAPTSTSVPEPLTIVGTLIGGSAILRIRRKLTLGK